MKHSSFSILIAFVCIVTTLAMFTLNEQTQPVAKSFTGSMPDSTVLELQQGSIPIDHLLRSADREYGSWRAVSVIDLQAFEDSDSVLLFFTLARHQSNLGEEAIVSGQSAPAMWIDSGQFVASISASGNVSLREITNPKCIEPGSSLIFKSQNELYLWDGLLSIRNGPAFFRFSNDSWVEVNNEAITEFEPDLDLKKTPIGTSLGNNKTIDYLVSFADSDNFQRIAHNEFRHEIEDEFESRKHGIKIIISGYNIRAISTHEPHWETRIFPFAK